MVTKSVGKSILLNFQDIPSSNFVGKSLFKSALFNQTVGAFSKNFLNSTISNTNAF